MRGTWYVISTIYLQSHATYLSAKTSKLIGKVDEVLTYNIRPQEAEFSWPDSEGVRRPVQVTGIWLGSPGKNFRHAFVPVVVSNEKEPSAEGWGVLESRSKRPKIVADADAGTGMVALLSSYNGDGKAIGRVLADIESLGNIFLLDFGIGGRDRPPMRWHDYLVELHGPCRFSSRQRYCPIESLSMTGERRLL